MNLDDSTLAEIAKRCAEGVFIMPTAVEALVAEVCRLRVENDRMRARRYDDSTVEGRILEQLREARRFRALLERVLPFLGADIAAAELEMEIEAALRGEGNE